MIALAAVCFMVAAKDVKVRWGPQARLGVIAVTAPRLVRDLSAKLIGSDALLMFGSFITVDQYLFEQVPGAEYSKVVDELVLAIKLVGQDHGG